MDHLRVNGGVHIGQFLQGSKIISPIGCVYHYAAFVYLTMPRQGFMNYPYMRTAYNEAKASMAPTNTTQQQLNSAVVTQQDGGTARASLQDVPTILTSSHGNAVADGGDGAVVTQHDGGIGVPPEVALDNATVEGSIKQKDANQHTDADLLAEVVTPQSRCAAGDACKAPPGANLEGSSHHCKACGLKIHSALLCGMNIDEVIQKHPDLVGRKLLGDRMIVQANDNEMHCICFTCLEKMISESVAIGVLPMMAGETLRIPKQHQP